jgi:hypothetical protein
VQLALQLLEPPFLAVLPDLIERLAVHSRSTLLLSRESERFGQDVPPIDLVIQRIESKRRLDLGLRIQLPSKLFELVYLGS